MSEPRIEGFVAGTVSLTVTDLGAGVLVAMAQRGQPVVEAAISLDQSRRFRRLLAAAEKRATP